MVKPRATDVATAFALTAWAQLSVWAGSIEGNPVHGSHVLASIGFVGVTVPVAWRQRWPLAILCVVCGSLAAETFATGAGPEGGYVLIPILLVIYSVAAGTPRRTAVIGFLIAAVTLQPAFILDPQLVSVGQIVLVDAFFFWMAGGAAWGVGRYVHSRRSREADLRGRASRAEQEATRAERARIARELHDVIAHSVSVMGVQAGAAEQLLSVDPDQAGESLRAIQVTAREAIAELGRMVGVLRENADSPSTKPQPGLASLDGLLAQSREAGLNVRLVQTGRQRPLGAGVELSAYRVIQEALTNVRKHAHVDRADVEIRYSDDLLEVEIRDAGVASSSPSTSSGHGLIGMRERVALYGGALEAGRCAGGGFSVKATLPLGESGR